MIAKTSGGLWQDDLAYMSPDNSALWLSLDSFGVPLIVVGLVVLWLDRNGITPPPFIAWVRDNDMRDAAANSA